MFPLLFPPLLVGVLLNKLYIGSFALEVSLFATILGGLALGYRQRVFAAIGCLNEVPLENSFRVLFVFLFGAVLLKVFFIDFLLCIDEGLTVNNALLFDLSWCLDGWLLKRGWLEQVLLVPFLHLFPFSVEAARLPFLFISLFSIVVFFFLVKEIWNDRYFVLIAVFLFVTNWYYVSIGSTIRYYSALQLVGLLAVYFAVLFFNRKISVLLFYSFEFLLVLWGLTTHPSCLFLLVLMVLFFVSGIDFRSFFSLPFSKKVYIGAGACLCLLPCFVFLFMYWDSYVLPVLQMNNWIAFKSAFFAYMSWQTMFFFLPFLLSLLPKRCFAGLSSKILTQFNVKVMFLILVGWHFFLVTIFSYSWFPTTRYSLPFDFFYVICAALSARFLFFQQRMLVITCLAFSLIITCYSFYLLDQKMVTPLSHVYPNKYHILSEIPLSPNDRVFSALPQVTDLFTQKRSSGALSTNVFIPPSSKELGFVPKSPIRVQRNEDGDWVSPFTEKKLIGREVYNAFAFVDTLSQLAMVSEPEDFIGLLSSAGETYFIVDQTIRDSLSKEMFAFIRENSVVIYSEDHSSVYWGGKYDSFLLDRRGLSVYKMSVAPFLD